MKRSNQTNRRTNREKINQI